MTRTPYTPITEGSQATPGLWNAIFSALSTDLDVLLGSGITSTFSSDISSSGAIYAATGVSITSGPLHITDNSNSTDYIFLRDSSNQRSNYIIGSKAGATADGLNIWDDSGQTMIVSFSKQSTRFYTPVIAAAVDQGGAVFNVKAYGAVGDGNANDLPAINAAITDAAALLNSHGTEQLRAFITLGGLECLINSTITWPAVSGLCLIGGGITAASSFASGSYLITMTDPVPAVPAGATRLALFRDLILNCSRITGVGGMYLVNHIRTLVDNCYIKRARTYGIRSVNGLGLSNELAVAHFRFDEWPYGDGNHGVLTSTAISVEHNDAEFGDSVIGSGFTGIDVGGPTNANAQYCIFHGLHIYTGYRSGAANLVSTVGMHIRSNAVHTFVEGCYIDNCVLRLDDPFNERIVGNLFLQTTSLTTASFIELNVTPVGTALLGVTIAFNGFQNNGVPILSMITRTGPGSYSASTLGDFYTNLIDYNASSNASLLRTQDIVPNTPTYFPQPVSHQSWLVVPAGSALVPSLAFSSESSLGFYRSTTSTIALSSGTLSLTSGQLLIDGAPGSPGVHVKMNAVATNRYLRLANTEASGIIWDINVNSNAGGGLLGFFNQRDSVAGPSLAPLGQFLPIDGTAIIPSIGMNSERSLGWYRSATSTMALSYGTIDLTGSGAMTSIASLKIKSGANNSCGTAVLGSNGSVNVANTYVKTGDLIFLTDQTAGGTLGDIELGGIRNSSGFTILSTSVTDTSTVAWLIVRPG